MTEKAASILVIEDELALRRRIARSLSLSGYDVAEAADGHQGIVAAQELRPDLIICDMMMPELNGFGTLAVLHDDERTASIPVIVITALGEVTTQDYAFFKGARRLLTKPFQLGALLEAVQAELETAG